MKWLLFVPSHPCCFGSLAVGLPGFVACPDNHLAEILLGLDADLWAKRAEALVLERFYWGFEGF